MIKSPKFLGLLKASPPAGLPAASVGTDLRGLRGTNRRGGVPPRAVSLEEERQLLAAQLEELEQKVSWLVQPRQVRLGVRSYAPFFQVMAEGEMDKEKERLVEVLFILVHFCSYLENIFGLTYEPVILCRTSF